MKIGFLSRFDPRNIRSWSGTLYFMAQALEGQCGGVDFLGPDDRTSTQFLVDNFDRLNRISLPLTGRNFVTDHNLLMSRWVARFFERKLARTRYDVLFAPAAAIDIALLRTDVPIVYLSDTTWRDIVDYYSDHSNLSGFARRQGEQVERLAISKARAIIMPSEWAARAASEHYGAPPAWVHQVPFGANLLEPPSRDQALDHEVGETLEMLWVGVNWERKGGPIAWEAMKAMHDAGRRVRLTVVGCQPPEAFAHPALETHRFLDKRKREHRQQLSNLFLRAHFFILPTMADATHIVLSEACAHGVPKLVRDTGGVAGAISHGVNGYILPEAARGGDYARRILEVVAERGRYAALVEAVRDSYEQRLNWSAWARRVETILRAAACGEPVPPPVPATTLTATAR
jgi:glycosyltransferase involved in cell wall biosynthesis